MTFYDVSVCVLTEHNWAQKGGFAQVSRQSFSWYRPVFDLSWHHAATWHGGCGGIADCDGLRDVQPVPDIRCLRSFYLALPIKL